ncbi:hypothetical protein OAK23_00875 [Flavobacteriaceae bacterium]|nr:hypothetical protein [Flavobacteriaceae bacterium]
MEITLPKTDLHSELIKSKRISKIKIDLDYNPDKIDSNRLFHVDQIRKICIDYRLRFLDFNFFKGGVPDEAYTRLKEFELNHPDLDLNIKMMAPTKLFKLENYDDPLMFVSLGNNYYYLIHKWGNDMSYFRKMFMWPYKNIYNILIYIAIISLFFTTFVPDGIFFYKNNPEIQFFVVFLFMFKSLAAIFIYFGFAMGKNFNENIWNSKFYN